MKHLKQYEMWSNPTSTDKNIEVNYGDKKPELSDIVIEVTNYIKDNYDKIDTDILNATTEFSVGFDFRKENGQKYESFTIEKSKKNKSPYIHFFYKDAHGGRNGYTIDITDYDYKYLHEYFLNIYKEFKKKDEEKDKERHRFVLQKIEEEKIKKAANKFNL